MYDADGLAELNKKCSNGGTSNVGCKWPCRTVHDMMLGFDANCGVHMALPSVTRHVIMMYRLM